MALLPTTVIMTGMGTQLREEPVVSGPRWWEFFREPLARVEAESRAFLASTEARRPDRKVVLVLVTAAFCLLVQNYVGMTDMIPDVAQTLERLGLGSASDWLMTTMMDAPHGQLNRLLWWASFCLLTYVVIPGLVVRFALGERLRDYGVKLGGVFADSWVYLVMFAIAGPVIVVASAGERFQETYPFYRLHPGERLGPRLWLWESAYFLQFFGVEFFFRGFLLHGTRHRFGAYAIFVMMVPYCMLHFFKPMPECLASILGAIVLGFMSLRTRSIWMGTAIHVTVAATMDFSSLWRQGFIP